MNHRGGLLVRGLLAAGALVAVHGCVFTIPGDHIGDAGLGATGSTSGGSGGGADGAAASGDDASSGGDSSLEGDGTVVLSGDASAGSSSGGNGGSSGGGSGGTVDGSFGGSGGGSGSGGSSSGGAADGGIACTAANCHGCCQGLFCYPGTGASFCGTGGAQCMVCPGACFAGTCAAVGDGGASSSGGADASADAGTTPSLAPPTFTPPSGTSLGAGGTVTINPPAGFPADGLIFYTTDGTVPSCSAPPSSTTCSGNAYAGPFQLVGTDGGVRPVVVWALDTAAGYAASTPVRASYLVQ